MALIIAVIYVPVALAWPVFTITHTCWQANSMTHAQVHNNASKAPGARIGCFFLITRLVGLGSQSQNPN